MLISRRFAGPLMVGQGPSPRPGGTFDPRRWADADHPARPRHGRQRLQERGRIRGGGRPRAHLHNLRTGVRDPQSSVRLTTLPVSLRGSRACITTRRGTWNGASRWRHHACSVARSSRDSATAGLRADLQVHGLRAWPGSPGGFAYGRPTAGGALNASAPGAGSFGHRQPRFVDRRLAVSVLMRSVGGRCRSRG